MGGICFWRVSFPHLTLGRLTSHTSRKTILDNPATHLKMVNADLVSWVNLRRKASFSCFHKKTSFLRPGRTLHWKLHLSPLLNSYSGYSMLWSRECWPLVSRCGCSVVLCRGHFLPFTLLRLGWTDILLSTEYMEISKECPKAVLC